MAADNGTFIRIALGATAGKFMLDATSDSIDFSFTEKEISSKDSGSNYESIITKSMVKLSCKGNVTLMGMNANRTTYAQMLAFAKAKVPVAFSAGLVATKDAITFIVGSPKETGFCLITNVKLDAPNQDNATYSFDATAQGDTATSIVV